MFCRCSTWVRILLPVHMLCLVGDSSDINSFQGISQRESNILQGLSWVWEKRNGCRTAHIFHM